MKSTRDTVRVVTAVVLLTLIILAPVAGATAVDLRGTAIEQGRAVSLDLSDDNGGVDAVRVAGSTTATASTGTNTDALPGTAIPSVYNLSVSTRAGSNVSGEFFARDEDDDDENLSYSVVSGPDHGTVSVENNSFIYAPAPGYEGRDSFTYQANDSDSGTDTATVNVTVLDESPPETENVALSSNGAGVRVDDWGLYNGDPAYPHYAIDGNDSTVWAGSGFIGVDLGQNYSVDEIRLNVGDNTLGYDVRVSYEDIPIAGREKVIENHVTRGENYVSDESDSVSNMTLGGRTVRYILFDIRFGNAPPGYQWASIIRSIEVYPEDSENTPPSADNLSVSTRAGSDVSGEFFASDEEDDDENLSYSVVSGPNNGTVSVEGDTFTYTPSSEYEGTDSFTYQANDSDGGTDTATVTVTVLEESPPETENVALTSNGASARAEAWDFEAYPYYAIDGNDSTVWAGSDSITVDLGRNYSVDEIRLNAGNNTIAYDLRVGSVDMPVAGWEKVLDNHVTRGDDYVSTESESVSNITLDGRTVRYLWFSMESTNAPPGEQYPYIIQSIEVYPVETSQLQFSHRWNVSRDHRLQDAEVASDGGQVFAADLGRNVTAYDNETGTVNWQFQREGSLVDSSPVATGDSLYVGSGSGTMYALDQSDGSVSWTVETDSAIGSTPAVADGTVYFAANDGGLYAVDAATGDVDWQTTVGGYPSAGPVVSNGTVYVTTDDGTIAAYSTETGEERWSREFDAEMGHGGPAVADGRVIVAVGDQVYGLDAETGATQLAVTHGDTRRPSVTVAGGIAYLGSASGTLRAINIATGETVWTNEVGGSIRSEVSVVDGAVVFGTNDGTVRALDAENGTELASLSVDGQVPTSAVVTDRSMYVGTWDGRIHALDITD